MEIRDADLPKQPEGHRLPIPLANPPYPPAFLPPFPSSSLSPQSGTGPLNLGESAGASKAVIVGIPPGDPRLMQPIALDTSFTGVAGKIKRNTFACTNCHSQKSKCVPSDVNDIYGKPCVRCTKRHKTCTFDLSRRTRRRRRDSDIIANPEPPPMSSIPMASVQGFSSPVPRIDAPYLNNQVPPLVSPALNTGPTTAYPFKVPSSSMSSVFNSTPSISTSDWSQGNPHSIRPSSKPAESGAKIQKTSGALPIPLELHPSYRSLKNELHSLLSFQRQNLNEVSDRLTDLSRRWNDVIENSVGIPLALDPVTLGIISKEQAQHRLDLYRYEISNRHRLPFVKIPPDQTLDDLRQEEPILFVTIMSIVSPMLKAHESTDDQNMKLDNFTLGLISHHMMRLGNKSLELLKSLLTLCLWYNFPEWSNKTRYYFFNYICCYLIKDLVPVGRPRSLAMIINNKNTTAEDEAAATDRFLLQNGSYSRLVILVYFSALNINIFLRQPIQNRWGLLHERASNIMSMFESGPVSIYEPEEDEILLVFGELNHVLEKIHVKLHEAEEESTNYKHGLASESQIKLSETLLDELREIFVRLPKERTRALAFYHSVEAYLHEWMFARFMTKFEDPISIKELPAMVAESFRALTQSCLDAMHEFIKLPPELIASLPLFHTSRVIYTVGMLLLRVRYTTITVPAFASMRPLTLPAIDLVNKISESLDKSAAMYPYNNFLSKLRYVVALFVQIYASKVKTFVETKKGEIDFSVSRTTEIDNKNVAAQNQSAVPRLLNPLSSDDDPSFNNPASSASRTSDFKEAYPDDLIDSLSYQMADMSSLELGFTALSGEFWTDVFFDGMQ
ncbi:LADA_0A07514g1_1 [Lachancea dasiensis]|uniref:LADA_0A07514g1_1 n=1 Tax=Lachancea dasiensis TaxID=1072105 RepID=A0A1G4IPV8_9SACH|nr:LADA_0A07514g1_1 [Lachancea dasiensis]